MTKKPDNQIIKVHDKDNVAIIVQRGGLSAGTQLNNGIVLEVAIPQGHKVALADIDEGEVIVRYGEVIGTATCDISCGGHVNETNVKLPQAPALKDMPLATRAVPEREPLEGYTFEGFRNSDGSVGTKNVLGITTSVQCVAGTTDYVVRSIKSGNYSAHAA